MHAQNTASPAGEYYLRGVPETASGFKLNADSSFAFFFSYGALDRSGAGHWTAVGDTVVLNSSAALSPDFQLLQSAAGKPGKIVVEIKKTPEAMRSRFRCVIKGGGKEQEGFTDRTGRIAFAAQPVDTITLQFEFCPEKTFSFNAKGSPHRQFAFAPQPSLMDVPFQQFKLLLTNDGLRGGHPLSNETSFYYEKAK